MSPRRRVTPILDQLGLAERGDVLGQLLAIHPELLGDAEELARDQLKVEDADSVAEEFEEALRGVDADQLASRAGRVRGRGYVHVNEAACELLAEELEPYLKDLARRAALGLAEAAQAIGLGLLRSYADTAFRTRPLRDAGPFTFVAADALTMKVRDQGRVVNAVVLVATGVNRDGHREVLGVKVVPSETKEAWNVFFADLVARGLTGVRLVTSAQPQRPPPQPLVNP